MANITVHSNFLFLVLDSSSGFKPGFLYGNNYWLSSRSQCLDISRSLSMSSRIILNNMQYRDLQKEFPPFDINYFVAHFRYNSTLQYHIRMFTEDVITLGFCLPASCSTSNLSFILERILQDKIILRYDLHFTDINLIRVKNLKDDDKLSGGAFLYICIGLGLCFMTTTGTIYDIFIQKNLKKNNMNNINNGIKDVSREIRTEVNLPLHEKSVIGEILSAAAAGGTIRRRSSNCCLIYLISLTVASANGLATDWWSPRAVDNKVWAYRFMEVYGAYIFDPFIGLPSVDSYFFSSGCLMSYWYLKDKTNKILTKPVRCREKLTEFFIHIIKRFLRLTPVYMMVLGLWYLSSKSFDKISQVYIHERAHETYSKYWWRNLLYIHNLFGLDAMCMSWSWYLSVDMQCYTISLMILILSTIYFNGAVTILGALLISSIILTGYISYAYEYVPALNELYRHADILYIPPWMRINSYIIGVITGYILIKLNNNLLWKKKVIILCWCAFCFASACNVFILFLIYEQYISVSIIAVYLALQKMLYAMGVAWIVIACSTKHGGIVNKLLSFKGWIPFSRLTYCAYLLNPVIIRSTHLYSETTVHFEFLLFFVQGVGYIVISYFCAYVLSLMVEMPCLRLIRMFIHRQKMLKKVL
ncbi:nose resistant to fluoxetine protein 6 [Solenopsis invicta]|uniref:nose resistant to fluoxetine protein 6 n=1 Tax=Solenopsis invicta TaxID=13686 RepID=UPI00193CF5C8|nr:nose resistant to fluoxetine protein 6 [Solenopsis invicta]